MRSTSPVGGRVNLYAPWLVPTAIASASTPVSFTKRTASSTLVSIWSWLNLPTAPTPSSSPASPVSKLPNTPISPSTDTPQAWEKFTTVRVTSTLYS